MQGTRAAVEYVSALLKGALQEQSAVVLVQWVHDQMRVSMTSGGAQCILLAAPQREIVVDVWHILWLLGKSSYVDGIGRVTATAQTWQMTFDPDASEESIREACDAVLRAMYGLEMPEVISA